MVVKTESDKHIPKRTTMTTYIGNATSTNKLIDCLEAFRRVYQKECFNFTQWGMSKDYSEKNYSSLRVRLCFDLVDLLKYLKKWSIIHRLIDPGFFCFIKSFKNGVWFFVKPIYKLLYRGTDNVIWSFAPNPPRNPKCKGWRCTQKRKFSNDICVAYLNCKFRHFFCGDCLRKRKSHSVLHKYCTCMIIDIDDPLAIIFGDTNYYFNEKRITRTESLVGRYEYGSFVHTPRAGSCRPRPRKLVSSVNAWVSSDETSSVNALDSSDETSSDSSDKTSSDSSDNSSNKIYEQVKEDPDTKRNECAVCWEKEPSHAFNNCGHKCVCGTCATTLDKCVLCRQPGVAIKIYD